jgi:stage II sporulation protein M
MLASYYFLIHHHSLAAVGFDELKNNINVNLDENGFPLALNIFVNNCIASFSILFEGLIPIFVFPVLGITLNGVASGVVLSLFHIENKSAFLTFIVGICPHGVVEISAFVLAGAIGLRLSYILFMKCLKKSSASFLYEFKMAILSYVFIIIPFLIVAALIETFITPSLINIAHL